MREGIIVRRPAVDVDYLVQAWADDPSDDRLEDCCCLGILAVPFEYIVTCITQQQLIPFKIWAQTYDCIESSPFLDPTVSSLAYYTPVPEATCCYSENQCILGAHDMGTMDKRCRESEEINQSVYEHKQQSWPLLGLDGKSIIYIQPFLSQSGYDLLPLEENLTHGFPPPGSIDPAFVQASVRFLSTYFSCEVKVLPSLSLCFASNGQAVAGSVPIRVSSNILHADLVPPSKKKKTPTPLLNVLDMLDAVEELLPTDGYMILGVTDQYIYEWEGPSDDDTADAAAAVPPPGDDCLHGMMRGRAFGGSRIAILSTACYGHALRAERFPSRHKAAAHFAYQLSSLAHETMHCFGLDHCGLYTCCMNSWCDQIKEFARLPLPSKKQLLFDDDDVVGCLHLCPVCVRKLQITCRFNLGVRYQLLKDLYASLGLDDQAQWCAAVLRVGTIE